MTCKESVRKKFQNATAYKWAGKCPWIIYANDGLGRVLGVQSTTSAKAWASAAAMLNVTPNLTGEALPTTDKETK